MKTLYKLLGWLFGLSAFSVIISGIIFPHYLERITGDEAAFRFFIIFIPVLFASLIFHGKAKAFNWDDDLFYLMFKLTYKKLKEFFRTLDKKADDAKEKIKNEINEQ